MELEAVCERKKGVRVNVKTDRTWEKQCMKQNDALTQQTPRTRTVQVDSPKAEATQKLWSFSERAYEVEGQKLHWKEPEGQAKDKNKKTDRVQGKGTKKLYNKNW